MTLPRRCGRSSPEAAAGSIPGPGRGTGGRRHPGGFAAVGRAAITAATRDVYLGLALAAVATLVGVLVIVPRRFATTAGAAAGAGPAAPVPSTGEKSS